MPPYKLRVAFPLIFLLTVQYSIAAVKLPALFSDHMVLQREMRLPIWGTAGPGESIAVHIGNLSAQTIADTKGKWKVWIDPMRAGGPYEIVITGKDTTIISNVLVGEVWVCSGQSNMALEVKNCLDPETETASAQYPEIRHFQVKRTKAASALEDLVHFENGSSSWLNSWEICDPSTVGHFSGSAYFFCA